MGEPLCPGRLSAANIAVSARKIPPPPAPEVGDDTSEICQFGSFGSAGGDMHTPLQSDTPGAANRMHIRNSIGHGTSLSMIDIYGAKACEYDDLCDSTPIHTVVVHSELAAVSPVPRSLERLVSLPLANVAWCKANITPNRTCTWRYPVIIRATKQVPTPPRSSRFLRLQSTAPWKRRHGEIRWKTPCWTSAAAHRRLQAAFTATPDAHRPRPIRTSLSPPFHVFHAVAARR